MNKDNLLKNRGLILAGLASASLLTGCGGKNKDAKAWANAPGTKGFINLDAVKDAFTKNQEVKAFEKRVNEIFEGDNLIVFNVKGQNSGFVMHAREDLNKDKKYDEKDDLIFTLTCSRGKATLKGAGVNSYYKETWTYDASQHRRTHSSHRYHHHSPYFWYWGSSRWNRGYYTNKDYGRSMAKHRSQYRSSTGFTDQVKTNCAFENSMNSKHGAGFRNSINKPSAARTTYLTKTVNSGGFEQSLKSQKNTSGWGVRSTTNSTSSFSKSSTPSVKAGGSRFGGSFRGSSGIGV